MIVTLNEYTLALICGGVSCLTYVILHLNDIKENALKPEADGAGRDKTTKTNAANNMSRRHSQVAARFRAKRAESIKNDHVIFADEITADDEKFTPNPDVPDEEVAGILQKNNFSNGVGTNVGLVDIGAGGEDLDDAPSLNKFAEIEPLDDLLLRRRSLHSSPANSRSGSRSGSQRGASGANSQNDNDDSDEAVESATQLEIVSLKKEISSLREELAQVRNKDHDESNRLQKVVEAALAKLYPERNLRPNEELLANYLENM